MFRSFRLDGETAPGCRLKMFRPATLHHSLYCAIHDSFFSTAVRLSDGGMG